MIVTHIYRPVLTEQERAKRMEKIKQATAKLVWETEKAKLLKNRRTTP